MSGCQGCIEKDKDVKRSNTYNKAQKLANETGEWFIIYQDEHKEWQYIRADQQLGIPGRGEYVSPRLQNSSV